jgi:iron complex outermembrane receptor protein
VSVTALPAAEIEERSIRDFADLSAWVPNLEINNGRVDGGRSTAQIYMRGVGQTDFLFPNDPGVGLYVDDVYFSRTVGGVVGLVDIEQVEVLRGPQGTLYGKNTIGGAIKITSVKPTGASGGEATITVGSYERLDAKASIEFPIAGEALSARISAASRSAGDIGERPSDVSGEGNGDVNEDAVRAQLRWRPTDRTDVLFTADYTRQRQHSGLGTLVDTPASGVIDLWNATVAPEIASSLGLPADAVFDSSWIGSRKVSNATENNLDDLDVWGVSLVGTFQLAEAVTLKSITAYRAVDSTAGRDGDHSPFPILQTISVEDDSQISQEFQFSGVAVDERLNWFVGLYGIWDDLSNQIRDSQLLDGFYDVLGTLDLNVRSWSALDGSSLATFGQLSFDVTEQLSISAGGRYTREEKRYDLIWGFPASNTWVIGQPGEPLRSEQTWTEFTPDFKVSFKPGPDSQLYASYAEGFKAGGWNPRPFSPDEFSEFDPERLNSYEIGWKANLLDKRLALAVAAFYSDYQDIQLTSVTINDEGGVAPVVENAGKARITGIEAEFSGRITDSVSGQLGIGYMDAEYVELDPGVSFDKSNGLPETPEFTINGALRYDTTFANGIEVGLRLDGSYKSKTYKDPANSPQLTQDSFTLFNARATFRRSGSPWEVAIFGTNLTDESYLTNGVIVELFGMVEAYFGRPREIGASVTYSF